MPCFEPHGAFYCFPNIQRFGMSSDEFATRLLKEEKVAVVPGTAFGDWGEGVLRISYAYSLDSLKEALNRMERFVKRLDETKNASAGAVDVEISGKEMDAGKADAGKAEA